MQRLLTITVMTCALAVFAPAAESIIGDGVDGELRLRSIGTLSFAPSSVLLVGDGTKTRIVAIDTASVEQAPFTGPIRDVRKQIAARMGRNAEGISITDLTVNPETRAVFAAVNIKGERHRAIVVISGSDDIRDFSLANVRYATANLSAGDAEITTITDVAWSDGQIIASGRSNDSFASRIFTISTPLNNGATSESTSAETYHVAHGRWETKAPMNVLIPFKENDRTYVVGAFTCTPIVKYPIDALQPGAKVRGTSVLELGNGNQPIDMFIYEKDGKPFVLANTFRRHHKRAPFGPTPYWTVKFEQEILAESDNVNQKALRRLKGKYQPATDRVEMIDSYHGVMQMDKLDDRHAVVLRQNGERVDLETLPLP